MKISFEFDVTGFDLHATHLARILLDIQHLALICVLLAEDRPDGRSIFLEEYEQRFQGLVEATRDDLGAAELTVSRIKMESPLLIEVLMKLREGAKKSFIKTFYYIRDTLLFVDLKREEMEVGIQALKEEVMTKRIENLTAALKLAEKIPDLKLRNKFVKRLSQTLLSFATEYPPLLSVELAEEDKGDSRQLQTVLPRSTTRSQTKSAEAKPDRRKPRRWLPITALIISLLLLFVLLFVAIEYFRMHA